MLARLYYSTALAILPSAEAYLTRFERMMQRLDKLTVRIESYLEELAVKLAHDAAARRKAVTAVNAAFDRREGRTMQTLSAARSHLDKASDARDTVAKLLGQ